MTVRIKAVVTSGRSPPKEADGNVLYATFDHANKSLMTTNAMYEGVQLPGILLNEGEGCILVQGIRGPIGEQTFNHSDLNLRCVSVDSGRENCTFF